MLVQYLVNGRVYSVGVITHTEELGNGLTTGDFGPTPRYLDTNELLTDISVGGSHSCALLDNNQISCWGLCSYNRNGQGFHSDYIIDEPENITIMPSGLNATAISAGNAHTCAILNDNSVYVGVEEITQVGSSTGKYYFGNRTPISISMVIQ